MRKRKLGLLLCSFVLPILLLVVFGRYSAVSAPIGPKIPIQEFSPTVITETLAVDDGTAETAIGTNGTWEFIFLNRFTPNPAKFPLTLTQIQVYFINDPDVWIGDQIDLVVYQDTNGNPADGASFLYHYKATIQALDAWNKYDLTGMNPWVVNGPGDVLIGVIALETPGVYYFPAAIDTTASQQRSWYGIWNASPPPYPPNLPPDYIFGTIDSFEHPGNWLIRAVALSGDGGNENLFLPVIMKRFPPIPDTPVLSPINNPNGENSYTVSWGAAYLATSYVLEEDDNQGFSSPVTLFSGSATNWLVSAQPAGTYYYRVKAHNSWGDSGWSNMQSTTVIPPHLPETPVLSPINNPNGDANYTVTWSSTSYADSYVLEEDDNQEFSSPVTLYNGSLTNWSVVNRPAGTYYYRVKGHNNWGDGGWSNVQSTTVVPPPPPQSKVYVINNTGCTVCFEISGTGIGEKCYSSAGKYFYGSIPVGTYNYRANACCGSTSGSRDFTEAGVDFTASCGSGDNPQGATSELICEPK